MFFCIAMIADEWYVNGFSYAMSGLPLLALAFILPWFWPFLIILLILYMGRNMWPEVMKNWLSFLFIGIALLVSTGKKDEEDEYYTGY